MSWYTEKMNKNNKNVVFWVLIILFLFNSLALAVVYDLNKPQFLEVIFFDIGQGDAIFIEKGDYQILIDGGPSSVILEKLGAQMPFWDRTIDLVILTHPEHDHIAGLIEVLKRYKVENILWTGVLRDTAEYEELVRLIENEDSNVKIAQAGQRITTPDNLFLEILYPFENLTGQSIKNTNNTSIIIRLLFSNNCFLFMGDAYKSIERKIIDRGSSLNCNFLKVGHHGSKTSTSKELLEAVSPEIAVISAGRDNRYGHPSEEVLEILNDYGIKVLRTDELGDIKIISNGQNIDIK